MHLTPQQYKQKHKELSLIKEQSSPFTNVYKSQDQKLVKRIVFSNENLFRQWLSCLKFEIIRQNQIAILYQDYVLKILDYTYERTEEDFRFYITYNCDPNEVKPLFDNNLLFNVVNNRPSVQDALRILEIGIIIKNTGVCHSNIKPSNLLKFKEKIYITDYGSMRTHNRNYQDNYENDEDKNWQKNLKLYQCSQYYEVLQKSKEDQMKFWESKLKPKYTYPDIWVLGIIILQLFLNDPTQNLKFNSGTNTVQIKEAIQELAQNNWSHNVSAALNSLLIVKKDIQEVYNELYQGLNGKKPDQGKFKQQPNTQTNQYQYLYTSNLDSIKDNLIDLKVISNIIQPAPLAPPSPPIQKEQYRRGTSIESVVQQPDDDQEGLIEEGKNSESYFGQGSRPPWTGYSGGNLTGSPLLQNQSIRNLDDADFEKKNEGQLNLEIPLHIQRPQNVISVSEFRMLGSEKEKEEKLTGLFEWSFILKKGSNIELLSSLNYILEYCYEDVNLTKFDFFQPYNDPNQYKELIQKEIQQDKNIPIYYLPYLKIFSLPRKEISFKGYILNGHPHGLGKIENEKTLFQGIFHQGKFLWGTLYETKLENKEIRIQKSTGPFNQETQKIHGEECEFKVFDNKFKELEHYKGKMTNGKPEGKGIKISKQFNWKYIGEWVDGSMQGQGTLEQNGQVKYIGNYECGEQTGYGIKFYDKSNFQQGCFKNGQPQGIYIEKSYNIISKKKNHDCNIF